MPSFDYNGMTFWYTDTGLGGEPVVLVPGVTGDERLWRRIVPIISPTRRVITFDNRDSGHSSILSGGDYSPSEMAEDVLALFDHLGLTRTHVVGHSLGGQIAQELAIRAPARVKGVVLANTWSKGDGELDALLTIRKAFSHELSDDAFVKQSLYFNFGPSFFRNVPLEKIAEAFRAAGPRPPRDAIRRQIAAAGKGDTLDRLDEIHAPTLIIWSDEDRDFPKHHAEQLARGITGARSHCISGTGHCPMVEQPEQFAQIVLSFLNEIDALAGMQVGVVS